MIPEVFKNLKFPGNESKEHFMLKQISKYFLWNQGCRIIGTECYGFRNLNTFGDNEYPKGCNFKSIIDCAGVKISRKEINNCEFTIYGVEAKASLSDFRNGFCSGADVIYIIAPKDIIPVGKIPKNIGLIEIDFQNFNMSQGGMSPISFEGLYVTKKTRKNKKKQKKYLLSGTKNIFNNRRNFKKINHRNDV